MFLGFFYIALTILEIVPEQKIIPWVNNYVIGGIGVFVGLLLLGYGIHARMVFRAYVRRVEALEEERARQAEVLRQKEIALRRTREEAERRGAALRMTKGRLRAVHEVARRRTEQLYRVRGKLGERTKRLRQIERLAKVRKKK
jgi:hypothetical protein